MRILALAAATLLLFGWPGASRADADGPDFWRVRGVASNDTLNIRSGPSHLKPKIGEIPYDGRMIRNAGPCVPKLKFGEFQALSAAQQKAWARKRWCQIEYNGLTGWVAGRYLMEDQ